jgi:hypothetical protein
LDSLGEIHLMFGHFPEAEKALLDAYTKDPSLLRSVTLRKAAEVRRLSGDNAGAEALFERYMDAIARQPGIEVQRAHWIYGSGRRQEAALAMEKIAAGQGLSLAWSQVAVWKAAEGNDGLSAAARARETARSPADALSAALAVFVAQPAASAEEWRLRAGKVNAGPFRERALAYALLLGRHWTAAASVLDKIAAGSGPLEATRWRNLLGWALLEAGNTGRARELFRLWPVPPSGDPGIFDWMLFPKARDWRSRL